VTQRGEEAVERVLELSGGHGVHSVLECVGTEQAVLDCGGLHAPGGAIGRVGVPHYTGIPAGPTFYKNVVVGGGPAPVRAYIEELLPDVLEGRIHPGRVFDRVIGLEQAPDGYRAMDAREALKVIIAS
jgi:threonine dehydrogenase-like Zn-dependent dehydrogenase